jgi:hypothetical protein
MGHTPLAGSTRGRRKSRTAILNGQQESRAAGQSSPELLLAHTSFCRSEWRFSMIKWLVRLGLAVVATRLAAKYMAPDAEAETVPADASSRKPKRRRTTK